ncbi:hypothetical protein, partial [Klebsiella pneumoniae]|uniref:hypothetical protein n=1 Tax=Klebsiella pneumoniae TaxID=573 RepID=UPI0019531112
RIFSDVVDEIFNLSAAVARGIFYLLADLRSGLAFPCHFARREVPFRVSRNAPRFKVRILMAS